MDYRTSEAKSWVKRAFRGHTAILTTPMLPDGEIDERGLRSNTEFVLALPGVNGLYLNSIYQEFWTMTEAERKRVAEIVCETVARRVPVIVGCNCTSAREAVNFVRHAQQIGADMVMVWPPYYGVRTEDGVHAFYEYIAERVDIAIGIYSTTLHELGYHVTPEAVVRLAAIDNICAVKEVSLSLSGYSRMMELAGDLLTISSPFEEYHFYAMTAFPDRVPNFLFGSSRPLYMQSKKRPYCADFWAAVERKDLDAARTALKPILAMSNLLHNRYLSSGAHNIALTKEITAMLGMAAGPVRPPMSAAPSDQVEEARQVLRKFGILES
jgi:4-hydroxy-tetrahydrodipicolinate synthase